jgi:Tfp pilus assembly protein PilX
MTMQTKIIREQGSVLMTALLTITILTMICATSLYITSQNANGTTQTTSWQQSLAGAEAAVDQAINALNTGTWNVSGSGNTWYNVTGSLPNGGKPTNTSTTATTYPGTGKYNWCNPTAMTLNGEASNSVSMWVTIDKASLAVDQNGNQPYRIRALGVVGAPGPPRVSNQKLDNDLRKISLKFDRFSSSGSGAIGTPQAARRIEVIVTPVSKSVWARGITLQKSINMNGSNFNFIDSFDSTNPFKSTNGQWDLAKRQSHGDVGTINSTGSNLSGTYLYGNLQYSGPAVQNTQNVQGTISTPFTTPIPPTSDPTWAAGSWNASPTQINGNGTLAAGTKSQPALYKLSQITVGAGNTLTITAPNSGTDDNYIEIWVTGKINISGTGALLDQDQKAHIIIYADNDVTVSGSGINNKTGVATNLTINGIGNHNINISGTGNLIAAVNAPGYDVTIVGNADFSGALIGNTISISGSGSFHYDEALATYGNSTTLGNYAYASWFEDNSDPVRGMTY